MSSPDSRPSLIRWSPPGHQDQADLAVIIINWNVLELVRQNLTALFQSQGTVSAECLLIDNASKDGSVEAIRAESPLVTVIANTENVGFSAAVNQGMDAMRARHVLLLNPDMRVEADALQKTVEYLDAHPEAGVVGARLTSTDGSILPHVRHLPDIWSQLAILLKLPHFFPSILDRYMQRDFDYTREQSVESIRGSSFAINERLWKAIGGFDRRYFIWFEEVDYCKQAIAHGSKVMYVPTIHATDLVGRSFAQRQTLWKQQKFTRSMITFFQKWHPGWRPLVLQFVRPFVIAVAWVMDRLK